MHPVYEQAAGGATFTLAPTTLTPPRRCADAPARSAVVLVHLENPASGSASRSSAPGRRAALGEAFAAELLPRNAVENLLGPAVGADDRAAAGRHGPPRGTGVPLPDGEYYVRVTVERALAERGTPVETWTSPTFRIDRP